LELVETRKDTSTSYATENVSSSTVEERLDTLLGDDLLGTVPRGLVLNSLTRGHHHTTTNSVEGVRGQTGSDGDQPTESERGQEAVLQVTGEKDGLEGIVETEVAATVDDDTSARDPEPTVESDETIRSEGLGVDIYETLVLALTSLLGGLVVVSQTGTSVIERVDEAKGESTSQTSGGHVSDEPLGVTVLVTSKVEEGLELFLEGQVQGLSREITKNVSPVSSPKSNETLISDGSLEAVNNTSVGGSETTSLEHLSLILDEELHSLDGGSSGLRHTSGNTTEQEILVEAQLLSATRSSFRHFE
jgi:hypothetical protein